MNTGIRDVLGIRPVGEAARILTQGMVDGAGTFLGRICLPAAEEFGLFLRERVHAWRVRNIASITEAAEARLPSFNPEQCVQAHPRIVFSILEQGSWIDDSVVQDLWAGLLSSSCTPEGDDDSNLLFINLLADLTCLQARILCLACERAKKNAASRDLITTERLFMDTAELSRTVNESDVGRLDRELDSLRAKGLMEGGFHYSEPNVCNLTPTALALHMYVRSQGSRLSPVEFFQVKMPVPSTTEAAEQSTAVELTQRVA